MKIRFKWKGLNSTLTEEEDPGTSKSEGTKAKGISVLVNDVERYRGWFAEQPLEEQVFVWTRTLGKGVLADEYFRFGFINYLPFGSLSYSDFTRAGTWWPNGTWSDPAPGRTLY